MTTEKVETLADWMQNVIHNATFGNLNLQGNLAFTYDKVLAVVDRVNKRLHLNTTRYSVTSSSHKNLMMLAAMKADYTVVEYDSEETLVKKDVNSPA